MTCKDIAAGDLNYPIGCMTPTAAPFWSGTWTTP